MITESAMLIHQQQQQNRAHVLIMNDSFVFLTVPVHVQHGLYALLCMHSERQSTAAQCGKQSSVNDRSKCGSPPAAWHPHGYWLCRRSNHGRKREMRLYPPQSSRTLPTLWLPERQLRRQRSGIWRDMARSNPETSTSTCCVAGLRPEDSKAAVTANGTPICHQIPIRRHQSHATSPGCG
jgi:hypothetical protein